MAQPNQLRAIAGNLCFNVALPLVAVNVLEARGLSVVQALAISAAFPAAQTLVSFSRTRHLDVIGAISLTFIALGVAASLISGDAHFALAKESFFSGVFGLACLVSLLAPRPLMFYTGRSFVAAGDPERAAVFSGRWQYPAFRRVMRVMTIVWGVAFLVEGGVRVALVYVLPVNGVLVVSPLLSAGVFGGLMVWTIRFGKAAEAAALRRAAPSALTAPLR